MKHHNNETVSIIRSEAIINCDYTLEISGIESQFVTLQKPNKTLHHKFVYGKTYTEYSH